METQTRGLGVLALWTGASAFAVGTGAALGWLVDQHWDDGSELVKEHFPYRGWQVLALEVLLGALVLALAGVGARRARRGWGELQGRTPHRRATVMAVLLPGLLLGGVLLLPMQSTLGWVADHTSAAAAQRADLRAFQAEYRKAPIPVPLHGPAATPAIAGLLLRPVDLGADWFPAIRPNPSMTGARNGEPLVARAYLVQAHWSGKLWETDGLVVEGLRRYASAAQAAHYDATLGADQPGRGQAPLERMVEGLTVRLYQDSARPGSLRSATFVLKGDVFTLLVTHPTRGGGMRAAELERIVAVAVRRARSGA